MITPVDEDNFVAMHEDIPASLKEHAIKVEPGETPLCKDCTCELEISSKIPASATAHLVDRDAEHVFKKAPLTIT